MYNISQFAYRILQYNQAHNNMEIKMNAKEQNAFGLVVKATVVK